jgi:hypothetical protein
VTDTDHQAQAQERARATEVHTEAVKKRLADERQAREKAHAEHRDAVGGGNVKPTPTQEENDLAASGVHVIDKEPDGSPPDPGTNQPAPLGSTAGHTTRQVEPGKPASRGTYPTRSATPEKA